MKRLAPLITALAAALFALSAHASSHKSNDGYTNVTSMQLLPGWQRDDGLYMAAIQIEMAPGWKTYWREPGAGGIPPSFDWSGSRNLQQVGYFWPTPTVYEAYGTRTIGYENRLILPVLLKPRDATRGIEAQLRLDYGVCLDICIPASGTDSTSLTAADSANRDLITQAVALRPRSGPAAGMIAARCTLRPSGENFVLSAKFDFSAKPGQIQAVVVETGSDTLWASEADHSTAGRSVTVETDLRHYGDGALTLNRETLRFTLFGPSGAIDIQGCAGG